MDIKLKSYTRLFYKMTEYDKLYSFLDQLINHKTDTNQNIIVTIPDEIETNPKKRGRPPGSKNKETTVCQACLKRFHTDKFKKHEETSVACKKFHQLQEKPECVHPIHQLIIEALDKATHKNNVCNFCEEVITDPKQHFTDSVVCNRMAYDMFKRVL